VPNRPQRRKSRGTRFLDSHFFWARGSDREAKDGQKRNLKGVRKKKKALGKKKRMGNQGGGGSAGNPGCEGGRGGNFKRTGVTQKNHELKTPAKLRE